ncbi:MAG: hypothetical protein KatS3mg101_1167 [Patescibacteria group bacterium]|nr:MAG: hypothetical protein KatS3mg101_1167 [Patescibacteria group bacterium]
MAALLKLHCSMRLRLLIEYIAKSNPGALDDLLRKQGFVSHSLVDLIQNTEKWLERMKAAGKSDVAYYSLLKLHPDRDVLKSI